MTPDEADARRVRFEALTAAGTLSSRSPQASVSNPEWFGQDGRATFERDQFHQRLLTEFEAEAPEVPRDRQAVIISGPPGAGKSAVRDDILRDSGTTARQWRHLDPDAFRDRLAAAMRQDGSLREVVPPEAAPLQPTPRELSSQLFVESAKLANAAQKDAVARGDNLMIEGVYSDPKRLADLVKTLEKKGYDVHLATVDVSLPDVVERTQARYRTDAVRAAIQGMQGEAALGGRFVPGESLAGHFDQDGTSRATAVARRVAGERGAVQSVRQYSVAGADQPAELASVAQRQGGMRPVEAELYRTSRAAGMTEALPRGTGLPASGPDQPHGKQQGGRQTGQQQAGKGERPDHLQRQQGGRGDARER